ncbi:hypothetical protein, partial [Actinophytocola sp.]|uniref:hypothetical protein n=1 Tax=Actinophytocola sp. TaxID=1872138 RepID=UPI002ECFEE41
MSGASAPPHQPVPVPVVIAVDGKSLRGHVRPYRRTNIAPTLRRMARDITRDRFHDQRQHRWL